MADIVLTGNTSGAITIAAPAAAGTNTITLPASTGTMALTSDIGGALTLLATANTTSGTSVSSGTLDLSSYKQVWTDMYSVGPAVNGGFLQFH